jgi:phage baseplate assembly protein W
MIAMRFPYGFDSRGRTATATPEERVRQLVEQVLFTSPGERVNRPTFGSDLGRLVFTPNSEVVASATQLAIQGALMQWLVDLVIVQAVDVVNDGAALLITVQYVLRENQERRVLQLVHGG